jgi:transposase
MEGKLKSFRKRSREENRGRTRAGRRYSRQLRRDAVAYLERKKRDGASVEQVASELGVSVLSLSRWSGEQARVGSLVPVEVVVPESTELSVVTPGGYRIEGLSEESVVRLVERLG